MRAKRTLGTGPRFVWEARARPVHTRGRATVRTRECCENAVAERVDFHLRHAHEGVLGSSELFAVIPFTLGESIVYLEQTGRRPEGDGWV